MPKFEGLKILGVWSRNSSRIWVSEQNFEQNERLLRVFLAGRISHFTSRIYPNLASYRCHLDKPFDKFVTTL